MGKKSAKGKKSRPGPKPNPQIPVSAIRRTVAKGLDDILDHAREYPFYGCWMMASWKEEGLTPVVVARQPGPDRIIFGNYMVDLYCLGVKDAYTRSDYSLSRFTRDLPMILMGEPDPCSVDLAHEVIYGAMEYAAKLGFQPHPDFYRLKADQILDPPEAHHRSGKVKFGKDGKPLFIAGPNDNQLKIRSVINTLTRTVGEGNFDYIVGLSGPPE